MMVSLIAASILLATPLQEPPFPKGPIKPLKVVDIAGKAHSLPATGAKATVVVFVLGDCPIANRLAPEISRIHKAYQNKKVSFLLAYVDPSSTVKDVKMHMKSFGYACSAFIDKKHTVVKALGATVTPQAAVLDAKGNLVYRGRINDLYEEHGASKSKPSKNDLRQALNEVLAGKPVTNPLVTPVGCYIPPPG